NSATLPTLPALSASPRFPRLPESQLPMVIDFTSITLPVFHYSMLQPSFDFTNDPVTILQIAILSRLGIRYRYTGIDDRGYDCSGFVWRVFKDAGADFERVAARTLWRQLPVAKAQETRQFGTLVFFNGLKHIGIVHDAETFYHSSRSRGVVLSPFAGYWEKRLTGFRQSPIPIIPIPSDTHQAVD